MVNLWNFNMSITPTWAITQPKRSGRWFAQTAKNQERKRGKMFIIKHLDEPSASYLQDAGCYIPRTQAEVFINDSGMNLQAAQGRRRGLPSNGAFTPQKHSGRWPATLLVGVSPSQFAFPGDGDGKDLFRSQDSSAQKRGWNAALTNAGTVYPVFRCFVVAL